MLPISISGRSVTAFCPPLLFVLLFTALSAQDSLQIDTTLLLQPVHVIGVHTPVQPDGTTSVGAADYLAHDPVDILRRQPGMSAIRKGGNYGFDPVFRGFKYDQLNVVLNGAQGATAACPNRMDPPTSQMAPNVTERIEILKGPHALRYGNGFGGTINFVPEVLQFNAGQELYGRVSTGYETNGNVRRSEGRVGLRASTYDVSVFGSWSAGNDYTTGEDGTVQADFSRTSVGTQLGFRPAKKHEIRLLGLYNRARDADFPALPMDLRDDDTYLFNLAHEYRPDGERLRKWSTALFGSFVDHRMDNFLKPLDPRMLNAATDATTHNYGGRTEATLSFHNATLFVGTDYRQEGASGIRTREFLLGPMAGNTVFDNAWQDGFIQITGLFTEYRLFKGKTQFVLAGRLELNRADLDDPSPEFVSVHDEVGIVQLNPSISAGLSRRLGTNWRTGLWLGRSQRSGGLHERFINYFPIGLDPFELLGTPDLRPAVNHQLDLTLSNTQGKNHFSLDLFAAYLTDFITSTVDPDLSPRLPSSPGVRRFVNLDAASKLGFEFSWERDLFAGLHQNLSLAYVYAQDLERDQPLPEIAPLDLRYALSGSYLANRLQPSVSFRYAARQNRVSTEFGETTTPSFALLDLSVYYQATAALYLRAGLNNLFDVAYYEHLNRSVRGTTGTIFEQGRNVVLTAGYAW